MGVHAVQNREEREASGKALNSRVSRCRARERREAEKVEVLIFLFIWGVERC